MARGRRKVGLMAETKGDRSYKEIKRTISKRAKRMKEEEGEETIYVDSSRMVSVNMGSGADDLRAIMAKAGAKIKSDDRLAPGEPNLIMYLKLAEHQLKKGQFETALQSVAEAAEFSPESSLVMLTAARIHALKGTWEAALRAAEYVLDQVPRNSKALLIKAESLFNLCQFELALVYFHRGQSLNPELDDFRLGIQKCRKTITATVQDDRIFHLQGIESMFKLLRQAADQQDRAKHMTACEFEAPVPVQGLFGVVNVAKAFQEKLKMRTQRKEAGGEEMKEEEIERRKIKSVLTTAKDMDMDMDMAIDRSTNSADRLSRDKAYLTRLGKQLTPRRDISHDRVQKSIKKTTCETIEYLKKREQFWQQLDFRKDEGATHVESYRFLM